MIIYDFISNFRKDEKGDFKYVDMYFVIFGIR